MHHLEKLLVVVPLAENISHELKNKKWWNCLQISWHLTGTVTNVEMDYFGPIEVKRGCTIVERYRVLFTCLTTWALHIEVSYTLDINAIQRFMYRRGQIYITSDNGTNLVGAERELRAAIQEMDQTKAQSTLSERGIQWILNPPAGPHFGIWRQVRLVKRILKSVLCEQTVDNESLQTLNLWGGSYN